MYANLAVTIHHEDGSTEDLAAWALNIENGRVTISLDAADGSGSHAEPAGERAVSLDSATVSVAADF